MKKLIASAVAATFLLLPAAPASASTAAAELVRVTDCPPGYMGYVVQAWNEKRGWYDVVRWCVPYGPESSATDAGTLGAGVTRCGTAPGHFIVWYYDLDGNYQEPWNSCI